MSQRTTVANAMDSKLRLRERQFGRYGHSITVGPLRVRDDVSSTVFKDRNRNSLRPSEIVVFIDGEEFEKTLIPETLTHFAQLIFELDSNGDLLVYGIRARLTDISRIWGLGFLGRNYGGRQRELVLRSRLRNRDVPSSIYIAEVSVSRADRQHRVDSKNELCFGKLQHLCLLALPR